jgi:hypothetical protein
MRESILHRSPGTKTDPHCGCAAESAAASYASSAYFHPFHNEGEHLMISPEARAQIRPGHYFYAENGKVAAGSIYRRKP